MEVIDTHFAGIKVFVPKVWKDKRGYFLESYQQKSFLDAGIPEVFCQDNEAFSVRGVLRGLHYQKGEFAQGKLVRVIQGEVLDVVIDLRKDQPTYGKQFSIILNERGKKLMYVPPGFAHGYVVLSETALFSYKCTQYYHPASEAGIHPLDPTLQIDWLLPKQNIIMSEKDNALPNFGKHQEP